jgi:hypothetical protein
VDHCRLRLAAILLAALAMGMHLAHALELAPKRQWDPALYIAVQSSLYRWFGIIGPLLEVGALLLVATLVANTWRDADARRLPLVSLLALLVALVTWALVVLPANAPLAAWHASGIAPSDWMAWRDRWQFGQAGIFVVHVIGFCALVAGSVGRKA